MLIGWFVSAVVSVAQVTYGARVHQPEWPAIHHGDQIVHHFAYSLCYSEEHEQARWVAYELTRGETNGPEERSSGFYEDPAVTTGSATDADYAGSGYDRGHLAPAGDMTWSDRAMRESFFYSNMSPQAPSFNRGIWKKLETLVRAWAQEYNGIYIVTGPVLQSGLETIGPERVSVPHHYYKVILDGDTTGWRSIGFLMQNAASAAPLETFAVTVDEVERVTGIDFFPFLPDALEEQVESDVTIRGWNFNIRPLQTEEQQVIQSPYSSGSGSEAVQCSGITKAGARCRNRTTDPSGRCHYHR